MSSLLDILQKKAGSPAMEKTAAAPASAGSHTQTAELHLAVDNRGSGELPAERPEVADIPELTVGLQEELPATRQQPDAGLTPESLADPVADANEHSANETQSFLVNQRTQRVRRNTSLLVGSLVLILLAVTTAISILLQYTADRSNEQSVVISPEVLQPTPSQPVASTRTTAARRASAAQGSHRHAGSTLRTCCWRQGSGLV